MNTQYIITEKTFRYFKRQAKKISKETGVKHTEALEMIAKKSSFHSWKQISDNRKRTEVTETAFKSGFIVAMDIKEADDIEKDGRFIPDHFAAFFCEDDLYSEYIRIIKKEDKESFSDYSEEQLRTDCREDIADNYIFFRYQLKTPETIDAALTIIEQWSYWPARYLWLKGHFYSIDDLNLSQEKITLEDFFSEHTKIVNDLDTKEGYHTFHLKLVDGTNVVLVRYDNGNPETLTPRQDLYPYTGGYNWGYKGSGVFNLAYAMLGKCFMADTEKIEKNVTHFVENFLSKLDGDKEHIVAESEILSFLK